MDHRCALRGSERGGQALKVELTSVTHSFGPFKALDDVSFSAEPGQISALVGENGAGKTTLMRVLYGALQPDNGTIRLDGRPVTLLSSSEAIRHGVGMVSQHYSIVPALTCLQNLMLGAEPGAWIDLKRARERAGNLAQSMGFDFDWDAKALTLSPASAQKLEILKLLWREAKVMVLDEPTAMLSPADSDSLYANLHELAHSGRTVIVVTHRLQEVTEHCAEVTVLRGGRLVGKSQVAETSLDDLARQIVGHSEPLPVKEPTYAGEPALVIRNLSVKGYRGDLAVDGLDLVLHEHETVGIAGVDGNGQRELFAAIAGLVSATGESSFRGSDWAKATTQDRIRQGLRILPEDRHAEGVIDEWDLNLNAVLGLQRLGVANEGGRFRPELAAAFASKVAERFRTKHSGLGSQMASLSGGNQQRFVAGRALAHVPGLVLAFQPTRGLDIEGTAQVYAGIRASCAEGGCALVVSFDLDELLEHCDRVLVMNKGKLIEPSEEQSHDRHAIGAMMVAG